MLKLATTKWVTNDGFQAYVYVAAGAATRSETELGVGSGYV
jgi:hypothetical protein